MMVRFPLSIQQKIAELLQDLDVKDLKSSSCQLSDSYRRHLSIKTQTEQYAYLAARMPATFGALVSVLKEIHFSFSSILDLGAGPGTTFWALKEFWQKFNLTSIEKDPLWEKTAKFLGYQGTWVQEDFSSYPLPPNDLVILSYSLIELDPCHHISIVKKAWNASLKALVIVEPGTPYAYENLMRVRTSLIEWGGHLVAPCPHAKTCPLVSKWCHFPVRIERNYYHRTAKNGSLSYEDEKFSYLIFTKDNYQASPYSRLIGDPKFHSGHVELPLCCFNGEQQNCIYSKKKCNEEGGYKRIKKINWGEKI